MTGIGLELSRLFYERCVEPLIARRHRGLIYAAARVGDGSEVLSFDTAMSADHNYGPTLQVFLPVADFATTAPAIMETLDRALPEIFEGWSTRFASASRPSPMDPASGALGSAHGVELFTLPAWNRRRFGADLPDSLTPLDWLAYPDQLFLTTSAGAVFHDTAGELTAFRERLAYFPRDIWLYKLAAQWDRIGEEQPFVGRTGDTGDEIGSHVISARLARDAMRLAFLVEKRYAPYPKWFGTAFAKLDLARELETVLTSVVLSEKWREREAALVEAYRLLAEAQVARGVPGAIKPVIAPFWDRPYTVINAEDIATSLRLAIGDDGIRALPNTGAVDQWIDSTAVLSKPVRARRAMAGLLGS